MSKLERNTVDIRRHMFAIGEELGVKAREWYSMVGPYTDSLNIFSQDNDPHAIGAKRSFVPALGNILWEIPLELELRSYYAYICQLDNGQKIGYIRVANYDYDPDAICVFEEVIARFEMSTDALIFDQVNNGGGSMFQMYSILEMLTDKPLALPKHQITIDEDLAAIAADVVEEADAKDIAQADESPSRDLVTYYRFVLSEKNAGRGTSSALTNPMYLNGVSEILPAKINYTKEIIVLINELSCSAAEFLAAILQDNKRAKLFGQRTVGAGGCVKRINFPKFFSFDGYLMMTWTIAWRTNGQPIENEGVTPDFLYSEKTEEDDYSGFADYNRALLSYLETLCN